MEVAVGWGASVGTVVASAVVVTAAVNVGGVVEEGWDASVGTGVFSPVGAGSAVEVGTGVGVLAALQAASRSAASGIINNFVLSIMAFTTSLLGRSFKD